MTNKIKKPKILIWDIETSMCEVRTFQFWNTNIQHTAMLKDWYIICGSWSFLDEDIVYNSKCTKAGLKKGNDKNVVKDLCKAISKADMIVGHNGDKFDLKKLKARVLKHALPPVSHIKTLDTLKVVKREFNLSYNNLDYIAKYCGVGEKIVNESGLWDKVMNGDTEALERMVRYCNGDVKVLKEVYKYLLPYITNHPNLNVMSGNTHLVGINCPNCGSDNTIKNGKRPVMKISKVFQRRACMSCGNSFLEKKPLN